MGITVHPDAKALIFDLDGTLSDSLPVHIETWNVVGKEYGFEFDTQLIYELTGRPTIEFAKCIVERNNIDADPQKLVKMKQKSFWDHAHKLEEIKEVTALVKHYHGKLPMAVGTGASIRSAEVQLEALGLKDYFDTIVSASDVTNHKPDPETFVTCAKRLNVDPADCHVFEDGDLGISAAKEAGMFVTDVREFISYGEWAVSPQ